MGHGQVLQPAAQALLQLLPRPAPVMAPAIQPWPCAAPASPHTGDKQGTQTLRAPEPAQGHSWPERGLPLCSYTSTY